MTRKRKAHFMNKSFETASAPLSFDELTKAFKEADFLTLIYVIIPLLLGALLLFVIFITVKQDFTAKSRSRNLIATIVTVLVVGIAGALIHSTFDIGKLIAMTFMSSNDTLLIIVGEFFNSINDIYPKIMINNDHFWSVCIGVILLIVWLFILPIITKRSKHIREIDDRDYAEVEERNRNKTRTGHVETSFDYDYARDTITSHSKYVDDTKYEMHLPMQFSTFITCSLGLMLSATFTLAAITLPLLIGILLPNKY